MPKPIEHLQVTKEYAAQPQRVVVTDSDPKVRDFLAMYKKDADLSGGYYPHNAPAAATLDIHRRFGADEQGMFVPAGYGVEVERIAEDKPKKIDHLKDDFENARARIGGLGLVGAKVSVHESYDKPKLDVITSRVNNLTYAGSLEELLDTSFKDAVSVFNETHPSGLHLPASEVNTAVQNARAADANPAFHPQYR